MREYTNIFEIVQAQDLGALKQAVLEVPKIMGEVNEAGVPAIHKAAETGNVELMKFVIEYSIVNPCILDGQGNTILHYAVKSGNLELVKYLTERVDMPIDRGNLLGVTAFDLAVELSGESTDQIEEPVNGIVRYFREVMGAPLEEFYHNPIRRGMHPDPSVVRVGEDYYMVNSSFMFFPCIPISHSKDLLHWEVIGHAITNPEWARLKGLEGGRGYWAPDISYYEGKFYITATYRLNDGGAKLRYQMVTSADKPEGPYCEPVFLDEDGIDPSIFTDVDGRRYMLLNRGARIFEISPDGREILSKPKLLWYGHNKKASEGPHLLYKDGYYYLFMAEGGTGAGHRISVARSKTLMGVYESCPYNPILRQWDEERQLQCCGHGKPVQTPDGDWYIVYLCNRLGTASYGILGRETAMDPLTWTADGWPIVNMLKGPSDLQRKPKAGKETALEVGFDAGAEAACIKKDVCHADAVSSSGKYVKGGLLQTNVWSRWCTVRGATADSYEIEDIVAASDSVVRGQRITIHGNGLDLNTLDYGTVLLQPQQDFSFEMECSVAVESVDACRDGRCSRQSTGNGGNAEVKDYDTIDWDAGLTCYYDENSYLKLALAKRQGQCGVLVAEYVGDGYVTEKFFAVETVDLKTKPSMPQGQMCAENGELAAEFRIVTKNLKRSCYYRVNASATGESGCMLQCRDTAIEDADDEWILAAVLEDTSYLSSEGLSKGKRFTGAMAGIYVHGQITATFDVEKN